VFEQGGSFRKVLMIDLSSSSDEENFIADTSCDAEFAKKFFGVLNRDIIGPPGDGRSSFSMTPMKKRTYNLPNPASTASAVAADAPVGVKNDNSDDQGPD
jgi:hypothetical protein